jgi:APA family basic amino acid/polyamine antiporter
MAGAEPDTRLARRLGVTDAVTIGLGAMVGAGIFAALGPAAAAAGPGLLAGLAIAATVAACNAMSSAWLAAEHPVAGGTYAYGRARLGPAWGVVAGYAFLVGKVASCAVMALTFGSYVDTDLARPLAVAAVIALVAVNYRGVERTAQATRVLLAFVLASLAAVVVAGLAGGSPDADRLTPLWPADGPGGLLQSAAILFFAFAGYARIATLGEEVREPARTIPRAVPIALAVALGIYAMVAATSLVTAGAPALAASQAPLATVAAVSDVPGIEAAVRVGAALASLGVLLSLIAGVSRTAFAMADEDDLPRGLAAVHPRFRVPHRAEVVVGVAVAVLAATLDLSEAIQVSAFLVLVYYAIANAAALTLPAVSAARRVLPVAGLAGCLVLAGTLDLAAVAAGVAVVVVAFVVALARGRGLRPG